VVGPPHMVQCSGAVEPPTGAASGAAPPYPLRPLCNPAFAAGISCGAESDRRGNPEFHLSARFQQMLERSHAVLAVLTPLGAAEARWSRCDDPCASRPLKRDAVFGCGDAC
jgi:hypothetical protein